MPDAGFDGDGGGWFANWFNGGAFGPPMWETFHVEQ
jgi:S-formylglutathione hydrolase FrmB